MVPVFRFPFAALAMLLAGATAASAAGPASFEQAVPYTPAERVQMVFELGLGARLSPAYPGAEDHEVSPWPLASLDYLYIPGLVHMGGLTESRGGLSIGPSFAFHEERDSGDHPELTGLDAVDATYEAGLKATYEWTNAEFHGAVRYAFGGAEGLVGEIGANTVLRPAERLELKAGPQVAFASDGYMDAYFAVNPAESAASGGRFAAYEPGGGLLSVGVKTTARYELYPDWFLTAEASYDRLVGDAEDSPVVKAGSADQYGVGLALSRRFRLGF